MSLSVPFYALVTGQEIRKTKKGDRFFWQVELKTIYGTFKGFMWNAPADAETNTVFPHQGDIIEVVSFEDQTSDRGSVVIEAGGFERITAKEVPPEHQSILDFPKASPEEMDYALAVLNDSSFWENQSNFDFVQKCIDQYDREKWLVCPAATRVHHSFQGGLVVHTAEVLELCRAVAEISLKRYTFVNRDVLYAGAILHDIGKVETYYINDLGIAQQLQTERTIGHLFYGMTTVQQVAKELNHEPNFVHEVMHLIASHHGQPDYGSIKPCLSVEAGILSRADYLSSRNGMIESVLKESVSSGLPLQDEFRIYGDPYFASIGMKQYVKEKANEQK